MPQQPPSRRLSCILGSLRNPGSLPPRYLYFRSAHLLANRSGQEFKLVMDWKGRLPRSCEAYLVSEDSSSRFGVFMRFASRPAQSRVHIESIKSFSSLSELNQAGYPPPPLERKGYGYMRIVIFLAAHIARMDKASRLTIRPASSGLSKYYESCGFMPTTPSGGMPFCKMVFPLTADWPSAGIGPAAQYLPASNSAF